MLFSVGGTCNDITVVLQSLNAELEEALQEKEDLKNKVQDYVVEVKRAEDVISAKVRKSQPHVVAPLGKVQWSLSAKATLLADRLSPLQGVRPLQTGYTRACAC